MKSSRETGWWNRFIDFLFRWREAPQGVAWRRELANYWTWWRDCENGVIARKNGEQRKAHFHSGRFPIPASWDVQVPCSKIWSWSSQTRRDGVRNPWNDDYQQWREWPKTTASWRDRLKLWAWWRDQDPFWRGLIEWNLGKYFVKSKHVL